MWWCTTVASVITPMSLLVPPRSKERRKGFPKVSPYTPTTHEDRASFQKCIDALVGTEGFPTEVRQRCIKYPNDTRDLWKIEHPEQPVVAYILKHKTPLPDGSQYRMFFYGVVSVKVEGIAKPVSMKRECYIKGITPPDILGRPSGDVVDSLSRLHVGDDDSPADVDAHGEGVVPDPKGAHSTDYDDMFISRGATTSIDCRDLGQVAVWVMMFLYMNKESIVYERPKESDHTMWCALYDELHAASLE